jgi:hypothetical protein
MGRYHAITAFAIAGVVTIAFILLMSAISSNTKETATRPEPPPSAPHSSETPHEQHDSPIKRTDDAFDRAIAALDAEQKKLDEIKAKRKKEQEDNRAKYKPGDICKIDPSASQAFTIANYGANAAKVTGYDCVLVAKNWLMWKDLTKLIIAKDGVGISKMIDNGDVWPISSADARVLKENTWPNDEIRSYEVRLIGGKHDGDTAIVAELNLVKK